VTATAGFHAARTSSNGTTMDSTQLRKALSELNGQRDLRIEFATAHVLSMKRAFLIPQESDGLVKVSDGQKVYVLDAERVVWMEIG
jgi:hypothetical protein